MALDKSRNVLEPPRGECPYFAWAWEDIAHIELLAYFWATVRDHNTLAFLLPSFSKHLLGMKMGTFTYSVSFNTDNALR